MPNLIDFDFSDDERGHKTKVSFWIPTSLYRAIDVIVQSGRLGPNVSRTDVYRRSSANWLEEFLEKYPDFWDTDSTLVQWSNEQADRVWDKRERTLSSLQTSFLRYRRMELPLDIQQLKLRVIEFRDTLPPGAPAFRRDINALLAEIDAFLRAFYSNGEEEG